MNKIKQLAVFYHGRKVGTLALYQNRLAAFEYTNEWLADGFSISPFSLPLEKKVFIPKMDPFDGLFGVFSDSLPDGWGRLLADRLMLKNGLLNFLLPTILLKLANRNTIMQFVQKNAALTWKKFVSFHPKNVMVISERNALTEPVMIWIQNGFI